MYVSKKELCYQQVSKDGAPNKERGDDTIRQHKPSHSHLDPLSCFCPERTAPQNAAITRQNTESGHNYDSSPAF